MSLVRDNTLFIKLGTTLVALLLVGCSLLQGEPTSVDGPSDYGLRAIDLD